MNSNGGKTQIDADIEQCREDIRRCRHISRPNKPPSDPPKVENTSKAPPGTDESREELSNKKAESRAKNLKVPSTTAGKEFFVEQSHHQQAAVNVNVTAERNSLHPAAQLIAEINPSARPAGIDQVKNDIPTFDLADDVMAAQRKLTAVKRKSPGLKEGKQARKSKSESRVSTGDRQSPGPPSQSRVITELVARDIRKLHQGNL